MFAKAAIVGFAVTSKAIAMVGAGIVVGITGTTVTGWAVKRLAQRKLEEQTAPHPKAA